MPESRDVQSVVASAEQAAAAGDYTSAEQLLREAAALQEASLGPLHPDLANTLNNLGIVCEITQKSDDAERFFRRASGIAAAALAPDHPFVATSRKNLEDFCRARGKPIELPVEAPAAPPPAVPEKTATRTAPASVPREPPPRPPRPVAEPRWPRPVVIGVLVAAGLALTFIATPLFRSDDAVESPATTSPAAPPAEPAPGAEASAKPAPPPRIPEPEKRTAPATPGPAPVLVAAQLCRDLSTAGDWECVSPGEPVGPGPLFFYTRLKSPADTTVQHRWYRGNRLRQVVELRVRANTTGGYRTYSRNTVNDLDESEWRVELRTADGALLHQERFTVR